MAWAGAYSVVWNCYAEDGISRAQSADGAELAHRQLRRETRASMSGCWYSFIPIVRATAIAGRSARDPAGTYDQSGDDAGYSPSSCAASTMRNCNNASKPLAASFANTAWGSSTNSATAGWWDEGLAFVDPDWLNSVRGISGVPDGATNRFDSVTHEPIHGPHVQFPHRARRTSRRGLDHPGASAGSRGRLRQSNPLYLGNGTLSDPFNVLGWNVTSTCQFGSHGAHRPRRIAGWKTRRRHGTPLRRGFRRAAPPGRPGDSEHHHDGDSHRHLCARAATLRIRISPATRS